MSETADPFYRDVPDWARGAFLFGTSYLQDSKLARTAEEAVQVIRHFGLLGPREDPNYNPFRDEALRPFLLEHPDSWALFYGAVNPDHAQLIAQRVQQLKEREQTLALGGAFWSRMAAGLLSPESLLTLPLGIGELTAATRLGRALQAAGRTAGLSAGLTAAEGLVERGGLPDSIAPDLMPEIAMSALFGAALGGLAGAVTARSVERAAARHAAVHDAADGLRTPGVEPRPVAPDIPPLPWWERGMEGRTEAAAALRREIAATTDPDLVARLRSFGEASGLLDAEPRPMPEPVGETVRADAPRAEPEPPPPPRDPQWIPTRDDPAVSALLSDLRERDQALAAREAQAQQRLTEIEEARARGEEITTPEEERALRQEHAQLRGEIERLDLLRRLVDPEQATPPPPSLAEAETLAGRLRGTLGDLSPDEAPPGGPAVAGEEGGSHPPTGPASPSPSAAGPSPGPAGGDGAVPPPPSGGAPLPSPAALPERGSQRLAPGSGGGLIRWRELPWYLMKNNRLPGTVGEAFARWASEWVKDPGLRVRGVSEGASVEALTQLHGARYAAGIAEQRRAYWRYLGLNPDDAGPVSALVKQARQALPERLGGGAPEGKITMAEFGRRVGKAIATGGQDEIAEVNEAAAWWRQHFYEPFEREAAEAGVILSGRYRTEGEAAIRAEMQAREQRIARLREQIEAGGPVPVTEARQLLLARMEDAQAVAESRLAALAQVPARPEPYVPHRWLRRRVAERRDELVARIAPVWQAERPSGSWADAWVRAEIAVSHLLRESVPDTLERVVARHFQQGGLEAGLARTRAAEIGARVREMVEAMAPSRLGTEMRSALGMRGDKPPVEGLGAAVHAALKAAGVRGRMAVLVREIVGQAEDLIPDGWGDQFRPGHARAREIDVPTALIADFLDLDQQHIAADYARRMGAAIETARKFGDPSGLGRMEAMEMAALDEAAAGRADLGEIAAQMQAARDLRDKVLGTFRVPEDPSAYSIRTLRFLTNAAVMAQMGTSLWANVADAGRVVMAHGFRNVLGAAMEAAVSHRSAWRLAGAEAEKAGAALDLTLLAVRYEQDWLRDISADASLAERWADQGARMMQLLNLVAPWTRRLELFSGALHQSEMVELSVRAASGGLSGDEAARLAAYGIDADQARRIADAWTAAGAQRAGRLYLANTDAWADAELVRQFRAQLNTAIQSSVMRPGAADRPNFLSAPLAQALLLYKGFALTATQRLLMAGLQQRDARVLSGMLATVGIAWIISGPSKGAYDQHPILSPERLFQAIDRSGVLGIFGDLNNVIETASDNAIGLRPLLQLAPPLWTKEPSWAQRIGAAAGPAISPWLTLVWAFTAPEAKGDQVAGAIRRLMPFGNLIWLEGALRAVQREAGTAIGDPEHGRQKPVDLPGYMGGRVH